MTFAAWQTSEAPPIVAYWWRGKWYSVEAVHQAWREDKRAMEMALPYTQIMLDRREQRENEYHVSHHQS